MAVLGCSKLEAVNEILEAMGKRPVPSLETGQATPAGDAEVILDRISRRMQAQGFVENTDFNSTRTPTLDGGVYKITMEPATLYIRGCYRDQHRTFTLRGDQVYDADRRTDEFPDATPINLDVVTELPFEDLSPRTKELIAVVAAKIAQRRHRGNPKQDEWLADEEIMAGMTAHYVSRGLIPQPINPMPIIAPRQPDEARR